ncbi:hypothetical protein [Aeromicrobium sp. Leaf350]|uniref:hypothetical protein n=1 Tax=Aeromicrobium sp. Leaf350 TaxID=2876565 RepID=UPI001E4829BB|nr:hypothetical protein [Aeromicrobium sp. Leaf350]
MGRSVRQQARAKALEAQEVLRRERAAAEKRRSALGVEAAIALEERDELVRSLDLIAGNAVSKLTRDEHVPVSEVGEWVPGLSPGEAKRLRARAEAAEPRVALEVEVSP